MTRRYRTHVREEKAVEIVVSIPNLEEYKDAWLILCNNAKSNKEDIYKVYNDYNDNIYILVNPDIVKEFKKFISQFGEIKRIDEDRVAVFVDVECDYQDFDKDYIDSEYILGETD